MRHKQMIALNHSSAITTKIKCECKRNPTVHYDKVHQVCSVLRTQIWKGA